MARILVVDDEAAVREAIVAVLSAHGHEVTAAESAVRIHILVAECRPDVGPKLLDRPVVTGRLDRADERPQRRLATKR